MGKKFEYLKKLIKLIYKKFNYLIQCTCNDNSFWRSYDEVSIAVRDKNPAVGQAIVSKILLNGIENGQLSAKELKEFEEVEQGEECNVLPF